VCYYYNVCNARRPARSLRRIPIKTISMDRTDHHRFSRRQSRGLVSRAEFRTRVSLRVWRAHAFPETNNATSRPTAALNAADNAKTSSGNTCVALGGCKVFLNFDDLRFYGRVSERHERCAYTVLHTFTWFRTLNTTPVTACGRYRRIARVVKNYRTNSAEFGGHVWAPLRFVGGLCTKKKNE